MSLKNRVGIILLKYGICGKNFFVKMEKKMKIGVKFFFIILFKIFFIFDV